jgi:hypothetical protein
MKRNNLIPPYNSLLDPNLQDYFNSPKIKRNLVTAGFVSICLANFVLNYFKFVCLMRVLRFLVMVN